MRASNTFVHCYMLLLSITMHTAHILKNKASPKETVSRGHINLPRHTVFEFCEIYMHMHWGHIQEPQGLVCFYLIKHLHKRQRVHLFIGLCFKENEFDPEPVLASVYSLQKKTSTSAA